MEPAPQRMITCLAVCGLDSKLSSRAPPEQKWITSLRFVKEGKELLVSSERESYVELVPGLLLKACFNEVGKAPLSELEVVDLEIHDQTVTFSKEGWAPVSLDGDGRINKDTFKERSVNIKGLVEENRNPGKALILCCRTEESTENAISDIAILKAEKGRGGNAVFNVPQGYKIVNHTFSHKGGNKYIIYKRAPSKLEASYVPSLLENYPMNPVDCKVSLQLLPQFCFPEGVHLSEEMRGFIVFSFVLSSDTRTYCSCMIIKEPLLSHQRKKLGLKQQKIYAQKALCILSEQSYPEEFCQILQHLYRISLSKNDVPFHIVVEGLVNNLVMVSEEDKGKVAITYPYGGCNVVFSTSVQFPLVSEKSIYCLFKFLSLPNILLFFEALLLEKQIFIVSQSKTVIGLVFEVLQGILFPFSWEHVLIPILPESLVEYSEAIVPFVIGIPPSMANLEKEECMFLDLDHNEFIGEEMPPLPQKLQKQLMKRLSVYEYYVQEHIEEYLQNPQNTYIFQMRSIDYPDFNPYDIRDSFLEFFLSLMRNYNKFWNKTKKEAIYKDSREPLKQLSELFSVSAFLDDLGMTKIGSFGYKFSETTMFSHFIEKRCKEPHNPYYLFFDECIERKRKKKEAPCLLEVKPEKFRVTPPPTWNGDKDTTYQYETLPSIVGNQEKYVDISEIELELETAEEQNEKQHLFSMLLEKHSVYKGVFQPLGEEIHSKISKLNLQTQIETLANQLLTNQNLNSLVDEIGDMSEIEKVDRGSVNLSGIKVFALQAKSKRDLRALEMIQYHLESQIQQLNQLLKSFQSLSTNTTNVQFIEISSVTKEVKNEAKSRQEDKLTVNTLLRDTKSLRGPKGTITFDNRRSFLQLKNNSNIVIHNTSMKEMLNFYIRKQSGRFYRFVVERVRQEQLVWVFEKFVQLVQFQGDRDF